MKYAFFAVFMHLKKNWKKDVLKKKYLPQYPTRPTIGLNNGRSEKMLLSSVLYGPKKNVVIESYSETVQKLCQN